MRKALQGLFPNLFALVQSWPIEKRLAAPVIFAINFFLWVGILAMVIHEG